MILVKSPKNPIFEKIALSQKFYMLLIKIFLQKLCARCALTNSSKKPRQKSFFPRRVVIFSKKSCFGHVHLPGHFYKVFLCLRAKISPDSESSGPNWGIYVKILEKNFFHLYVFFTRNMWTGLSEGAAIPNFRQNEGQSEGHS